MSWTPEGIDGVFFITITTIITGVLGLMIKYCLKSKCENVNICCGLIHIIRRVDLESLEEMKDIENNKNDENKTNDENSL